MSTEIAAKRYSRIYRFLRPLVRLYLRLAMNYTAQLARVPDGPLLILSNHTSGYDVLFIASSFRKPLYYVGGEHLWRMGKALRWFLERYKPVIQRIKGATEASTAAGMLRALRSGRQVCLYPEGNITFTGGMMPLHPTTARLVKAAKGATIVTYRVTGGYFATPRWAGSRRHGKLHGAVAGIYTPQMLKDLSENEIDELLLRDLRVDAYELQSENPVPYPGKRLAEHLETALYLCPRCREVGTLHSRDDLFYCECGLQMSLDKYGLFHGENLPFKNPDEWDAWQEGEIRKLAGTPSCDAIFTDSGQTLWEQLSDHSEYKVCSGRMSLCAERFSLGPVSFSIREITGIDLVLMDRLYIAVGPRHFSVTSDHLRSGRKYVTAFKYLKERTKVSSI